MLNRMRFVLLPALSTLTVGCCGGAFSNCEDAPTPAAVTRLPATYAAEVGPPWMSTSSGGTSPAGGATSGLVGG